MTNTAHKRIILIDDEPTQNELNTLWIKRYMGNRSFEIIAFTDPREGLSCLKKNCLDEVDTVVLLDLFMSPITGWDILDEMTGVAILQTAIYVLSSTISMADILRAKSHPLVCGYFSKPLSGNDMVERLFTDAGPCLDGDIAALPAKQKPSVG